MTQKQNKPAKLGPLARRVARLEKEVRCLEDARPAVWPFTIVDDEPEAPGAKWQELPQKMATEMLNEGWREEAMLHGVDPDNLQNLSIRGMLKEYADPNEDAVEMVRNARF